MSMGFRVKCQHKAYVEKSCCHDHGADHSDDEQHVPVLVVAQHTIKTFQKTEKYYRVVTEQGELLEIPEKELVTRAAVEDDNPPVVDDEDEEATPEDHGTQSVDPASGV